MPADTDCGGKTCAADEVCVSGTCQCAPPKAYCGSGCVDITTSNTHCGMCDKACVDKETCSEGKCVAPCPTGQTRCGGVCVDTSSSASHCGGCGKACVGAESCSAGTCSLKCEFPNKNCSGKCVNIQFDANHCGDCGKVCPSGTKGTGNCTSGSCVLTCDPGFGNCDDIATNGCEVNYASSDAHCGSCFKACATTETCLSGKCECKSGTAKCGAACVDLTSSDTNCGLCGKTCAANEACTSSTCECKSGFSRCGTACVDTKVDATNCGVCGTVCGAGSACSSGKCCPTGQLNCGGICIDPVKDKANCGACGTTCSGTTPYCVASMCAATCGAGTTDCSGACVDTVTDEAHCGMCGKTCLATEVCLGSACVPAGFPGSTIVDALQGTKINTWIGSTSQVWKRCYTKATMASTAAAFHAGCDGKGANVTLARLVSGTTTKIIGAYTNIGWTSVSGWRADPTAFLFSVTNDHKHPILTVPGTNAVYHTSSYGPTFGGGYDWQINATLSGGYCNLGNVYTCRVGTYGSTTCQNDFCGTYSSWTVAALEVWVK